jgi:hypothetical protein
MSTRSIVVATVVLTKPHRAAAKDGPVRTGAEDGVSDGSVAEVIGTNLLGDGVALNGTMLRVLEVGGAGAHLVSRSG